jgi:uracil-DNA glycosylase
MQAIKLCDAMAAVTEGWVTDLPDAWRSLLGEVTLGLADMDPALELEVWEPIFPARRSKHFPGQPKDAHMLRAFDGIEPSDVRCVIVGQDPYPEPGFATGRAFEAGNVEDWSELDKMFSRSVRAFMQQIVANRTRQPQYATSFAQWPSVRAVLRGGGFESPSAIADRWVGEGVLLLNASLTLSRFAVNIDPHQSRGHLPLWRPLMLKVVQTMVARGQPVVFMGFGTAAANIFEAAGIYEGLSGNVAGIWREHPAFADVVLARPNPFDLCNSYLEAMGAKPVAW